MSVQVEEKQAEAAQNCTRHVIRLADRLRLSGLGNLFLLPHLQLYK